MRRDDSVVEDGATHMNLVRNGDGQREDLQSGEINGFSTSDVTCAKQRDT